MNECKNRNICGSGAKCLNTKGGYECQCKAGYQKVDERLPGSKCRDVNECDLTPAPCGLNAVCQNAEGHYRCLCKEGFIGNATLGCRCTYPTDADFEVKKLFPNFSSFLCSSLRWRRVWSARDLPCQRSGGCLHLRSGIHFRSKQHQRRVHW